MTMVLGAAEAGAIEYTVPLAVFDAVPVVFSILAYVTLARLLVTVSPPHARVARWGVVLIGAGGAAKVLWKVVIAASATDITWMDDLLFPLLAPGLLLLAAALRPAPPRRGVAGAAGVVAAAGVLAASGAPAAAEILLLTSLTVASIVIVTRLVASARACGDRVAASLVVINLVVAFGMVGLARVEQSIALQWAEEIGNAMAQAALFVAARRLWSRRADPFAQIRDARPDHTVDRDGATQVAF